MIECVDLRFNLMKEKFKIQKNQLLYAIVSFIKVKAPYLEDVNTNT